MKRTFFNRGFTDDPMNPTDLEHLYQSLDERIHVEFYPYSSIKHTVRKREGIIFMRISDLFVDAPSRVLVAIGKILLAKIDNKEIPRGDKKIYDHYINSDTLQKKASDMMKKRKRSLRILSGTHYNLHHSFQRVNATYFHNEMEKPILTWSTRKAKRTLGKYDPQRDAVIISRALDSPVIPEEFLDFIMYHELLHKKHGILNTGSQRRVHTPAFKKDEQKFENYEKMRAFLQTVSDMKI
jgi:predicted metal-dependent hydrolase